MAKISLDELNAAMFTARHDHPGRKGLFGRRRTKEFGRFRAERHRAREAAKAKRRAT